MKTLRLTSWIRAFGILFVLTGTMLLQGCGGGGGGGGATTTPPSANPSGYYDLNGSATVNLIGSTTQTQAITNLEAIVHNNRILMFSADGYELYDISINSIEGNNFSGSANVFFMAGAQRTTSTVSGTITEGSKITGTLTGSGFGNGTFSLNFNNQMGVIPGTPSNWALPVGLSSTDYVFATDGAGSMTTTTTVTDGNFAGCTIDIASSNTITDIGSSKLYNVTLTFTGCSDLAYNGTYTGLAAVQDALATALALAIVNSDGSHIVCGSFAKK